jgi:hypothetical protein
LQALEDQLLTKTAKKTVAVCAAHEQRQAAAGAMLAAEEARAGRARSKHQALAAAEERQAATSSRRKAAATDRALAARASDMLKLKQAVKARLDADMVRYLSLSPPPPPSRHPSLPCTPNISSLQVRHAAERARLIEEEQREEATSRLHVATKDRRIALLAQRRAQRETVARQVGISASADRLAFTDARLGPLLLSLRADRSMNTARLEQMASQPRAPLLHRPHIGLHVPWTAHVAHHSPSQPTDVEA